MVRWYNEATLKSKQRKQICCFLHHINCPSKRLLEWMKLIEANIILLFVLQSYLSSPYRSNFVRDFSSSVRIHESILMSSFMRHLRRSVKFWQRRKKWVVDSDSKLQGHNGFIVPWKLWLNLCSLRWLKPKRNLVRSLIPRLSETLNKLLGEGLINFSDEFLKTSYDTDLQVSGLKLFHSLIVCEKKKFPKYYFLEYIWRNLSPLLVW